MTMATTIMIGPMKGCQAVTAAQAPSATITATVISAANVPCEAATPSGRISISTRSGGAAPTSDSSPLIDRKKSRPTR